MGVDTTTQTYRSSVVSVVGKRESMSQPNKNKSCMSARYGSIFSPWGRALWEPLDGEHVGLCVQLQKTCGLKRAPAIESPECSELMP